MKRGSNISLSDRVAEMSIKGLLMTLLVLIALIALSVLITMLVGQTAKAIVRSDGLRSLESASYRIGWARPGCSTALQARSITVLV